MELTELIDNAPWREAVTYRDTWPHEYVLLLKDGQGQLMAAVRDRMKAGEGFVGRFFNTTPTHLPDCWRLQVLVHDPPRRHRPGAGPDGTCPEPGAALPGPQGLCDPA